MTNPMSEAETLMALAGFRRECRAFLRGYASAISPLPNSPVRKAIETVADKLDEHLRSRASTLSEDTNHDG